MVQREMRANGFDAAALLKQTQAPAQVLDPQQLANAEAIARAKAEGELKATEDVSKAPEPTPAVKPPASKPEPKFFEEEQDVAKESAAVPPLPDAEEQDEGPSEASSENFKTLKTNYKEIKKAKKELEAKVKEAEDRLKTYVSPETLREKDLRIAELSKYEQLHNLKSSSEYKEKYLRPIQEKHSKLKELLKDYGVPEESLDAAAKHAVSLNNHAELNSFLAEHFSDNLGSLEAKNVIQEIRRTEAEARSAEAEPVKVLESLQESSKAIREAEEQARRSKISSTAKSSWEEIAGDILKEGQIKELIYKDDDPEFNQNFPEKLWKQAASEYGKVITEMAKSGATPTKEVAKALAKMTVLSQVAGVSIVTRNRALDYADEIARNSERTSGLFRPNIGGGNGSRAPVDQGPARPISPEDELKRGVSSLVNSVLSKR